MINIEWGQIDPKDNRRVNRECSFIPKISQKNIDLCESPLSINELDDVIKKAPSNKSPGPDGLPFEFYRTFWEDIKEMILDVFKECMENGEMTDSMKQGLIVLIPKPNKDLDTFR